MATGKIGVVKGDSSGTTIDYDDTKTALGTLAWQATVTAAQVDGTAVVTADSRLSDARTPLTHTHAAGDVTGTAVLTADARLSDARTPLAHTHVASDVTGTAVLTADARLSDARVPTAHATSHKSGGSDAVKLDELAAPTDITTLDATVALHGLLPKLGGGSTNFLRADGSWAAPTAGAAATNPNLYVTAADYDLAASYSLCFPSEYEVGSGFVTDLAATAILEIA